MGWKISAIIINSKKDIEEKQLLNLIGYKSLKELTPKVFDEIMMPPENEVYIAKYKENWIICEQDLAIKSFEEDISNEEKILTNYFKDTEILSLALHSAVDFWGYSIVENGKKLRVKASASQEGVFIDIGEPLKEEQFNEEPLGEDLVLEVSSRYLGEPLNVDGKLLETKFNGYAFSKSLKKDRPITSAIDTLEDDSNFNTKAIRWVFLFIIIAIIRYVVKNYF